MPTPEETFSSLDSDRNGRLDTDEINSNRFIPRMLRDTDISQGLSRDEFIGAMQRARENFGRGGFGDRGRDSDRRRDRDRDGQSADADSQSNGGNSDGDSSDGDRSNDTPGGTTSNQPEAKSAKTRPRITIDLQSEFVPGDTDHDGQLGLYEWRRFSGRALTEFRELDRNQDGFVTPREVAIARPDLAPVATTAAASTGATPQNTNSTATNPGTPSSAPAGTVGNAEDSGSQSQPTNERAAQDADRFIRLLDKDRDDQVSPDEWEASRNIRKMFADDGINLNEPLAAADFKKHYIRLSLQQE